MRRILKNEKGFTLIELLAVIVILGILMIVAIPMVTRYIEQARRDTFVDTAKAYINAARYAYLNDDYSMKADSCTQSASATIPLAEIDVDNAGKSPFGGKLVGFVHIQATEKPDSTGNKIYTYTYSISIQDETKKWYIDNVEEKNLARDSVIRTPEKSITEPASIECS